VQGGGWYGWAWNEPWLIDGEHAGLCDMPVCSLNMKLLAHLSACSIADNEQLHNAVCFFAHLSNKSPASMEAHDPMSHLPSMAQQQRVVALCRLSY
jgi:hypothetical protein